MKKLHKIVMVVTNDKSMDNYGLLLHKSNKLYLGNRHGCKGEILYNTLALQSENGVIPCSDKDCTSQHLYILSDDKIEDGDWFITTGNQYWSNQLFQANKCGEYIKTLNNSVEYPIKDCKKIIASTDKKLTIKHNCDCMATTFEGCSQCIERISQTPQQFIDYYVTQYNKGNIITEVEVEYTNVYKGMSGLDDDGEVWEQELLINKDNTINISILNSKMYSKEELKVLFDSYGDNIAAKIIWKDIEDLK